MISMGMISAAVWEFSGFLHMARSTGNSRSGHSCRFPLPQETTVLSTEPGLVTSKCLTFLVYH